MSLHFIHIQRRLKAIGSKVLLTCISVSVIGLVSPYANAQQSLQALFKAYQKARTELALSEATSDHSDVLYWSQQYFFYANSINKIITDQIRNAMSDPKRHCQQALWALHTYHEIQMLIRPTSVLGSDMETFNAFMNLSKYCYRFGVQFELYPKM